MDRPFAPEETGPSESFWQTAVHFVRSGSKESWAGHLPAEEAENGEHIPYSKDPHFPMECPFAPEETGPRGSFWQTTVHFVRSGSKDSGAGHLPVEED